uniref:Uncharacterized protein n=1 Tax=Anopheles melas TaxID=34690 RepID=A0A182TWE2_9DIPT
MLGRGRYLGGLKLGLHRGGGLMLATAEYCISGLVTGTVTACVDEVASDWASETLPAVEAAELVATPLLGVSRSPACGVSSFSAAASFRSLSEWAACPFAARWLIEPPSEAIDCSDIDFTSGAFLLLIFGLLLLSSPATLVLLPAHPPLPAPPTDLHQLLVGGARLVDGNAGLFTGGSLERDHTRERLVGTAAQRANKEEEKEMAEYGY